MKDYIELTENSSTKSKILINIHHIVRVKHDQKLGASISLSDGKTAGFFKETYDEIVEKIREAVE